MSEMVAFRQVHPCHPETILRYVVETVNQITELDQRCIAAVVRRSNSAIHEQHFAQCYDEGALYRRRHQRMFRRDSAINRLGSGYRVALFAAGI